MEEDWICSICLEGKDAKEVSCHDCGKHWFHKECLDEAMEYNFSCPVCRHYPTFTYRPIQYVLVDYSTPFYDVLFAMDGL